MKLELEIAGSIFRIGWRWLSDGVNSGSGGDVLAVGWFYRWGNRVYDLCFGA